MKEIILHVGTEKTGSTSIQRALELSTQKLQDQGYLFPTTLGSPCHIHLTACALRGSPNHPIRQHLALVDDDVFQHFLKKTKSAFFDELASSSCDTVIISDEHINVHLIDQGAMENYRSICEEFGVISKVIIYLRAQDEFRVSLFSEAVKCANLKGFDIDNPLPIFDNLPPRFNYSRILDNLSNVFGEKSLRVGLFEKDALIGGDIVKDFCHKIGGSLSVINSQTIEYNRSLDARIIRPLAQLCKALAPFQSSDQFQLYRSILERVQQSFDGPGLVMSADRHAAFMEQFRGQNSVLKARYFPSLSREDLFSTNIRAQAIGSQTNTYPECSMDWTEFHWTFARSI